MSKNMLLNWVEPKQTLPKERQRFGNRGLFALILPILVEQLLTMLVGIADTLMVSYAVIQQVDHQRINLSVFLLPRRIALLFKLPLKACQLLLQFVPYQELTGDTPSVV